MHIMHMLGIICALFFIALFIMCFFREKLKSYPIINYLFIAADLLVFLGWNYAAYELGWLSDGFMTLENVSPYICTIIPLTLVLSDKVKPYAYSAIAFLGFGMFLAMFISPEHSYLFNYAEDAKFIHVTEAACHLVMSLYGFYLVLSDKVALTLKNLVKSIIFMFSTVGFGVFLNAVFHTKNFGMDMYGDYSIYFLDIFGSFTATFIAYLFGIFAVLCLGFLIDTGVDMLTKKSVKEAEKLPKAEK